MPFDRRHLLAQSAALTAAIACKPEPIGRDKPPKAGRPPRPEPDPKSATKELSGAALSTLAAVSARILPEDELGPGADSAGVATFLERALKDPRMAHLLPLLHRGAGFLNRAAQQEHQVPYFPALSIAQQDDLLQRMADKRVRPSRFRPDMFVRVMIALTLEGFLGDPKHGGNAQKRGWQLVGYDPKGRRTG